jgi:hypothetical protein
MYAFVPREEDRWDSDKDSSIQWIRDRSLGPTVAAGESKAYYIRMSQDYNFYLKWLRYSVYKPKTVQLAEYRWYDPVQKIFTVAHENNYFVFEETTGVQMTLSLVNGIYTGTELAAHIQNVMNTHAASVSTYTVSWDGKRFTFTSDGAGGAGEFNLLWTVNASPAHLLGFDNSSDDTGSLSYESDWDRSWMPDTFDYQAAVGNAYLRDLDVSVSFSSPQNQYLYGGSNLDPIQNGATATFPLPVHTIQGYDYGWGHIITPMLLPREGSIRLDLHNRSSEDLIVSGCIGGLKVRL